MEKKGACRQGSTPPFMSISKRAAYVRKGGKSEVYLQHHSYIDTKNANCLPEAQRGLREPLVMTSTVGIISWCSLV